MQSLELVSIALGDVGSNAVDIGTSVDHAYDLGFERRDHGDLLPIFFNLGLSAINCATHRRCRVFVFDELVVFVGGGSSQKSAGDAGLSLSLHRLWCWLRLSLRRLLLHLIHVMHRMQRLMIHLRYLHVTVKDVVVGHDGVCHHLRFRTFCWLRFVSILNILLILLFVPSVWCALRVVITTATTITSAVATTSAIALLELATATSIA